MNTSLDALSHSLESIWNVNAIPVFLALAVTAASKGSRCPAGADRFEAFLQNLGVGTKSEAHGVEPEEWKGLVVEALAGERGRNFLGAPEFVLGRL